MKVCILAPEFLPAWGGVGTYVYNLARGLKDRAELHVFAGTGPAEPDGELDGIRFHDAFPSRARRAEISPFRFQAAVFRRLPALARTHGFDIVHANHAYMSDLLVRLRRRPRGTVVTIHTTLDTQVGGTLRAGPRTPRQRVEGNLARWRLPLQTVERHYLRRTPAMIFVSRWVRDRTLERYGVSPRLSAVVPNAIDGGWFAGGGNGEAGARSDRPTLLFAGRLLALKGVDTLLRAMVRLDPRVRLLLAGPGDPAPWRELADDLGLSPDRCVFLGRVPYASMPNLYRQADAVVLPSFTESYPMVALEAMASGAPLVAADAGGLSEIVQDRETGWLFPPGDVDALFARIEDVLSDPEGARRVSARARAWVLENGSIDRMARDTYTVYERIARGEAS